MAGGVGLLGWAISPELAGRFEQVVGAMLVALGANLGWRLWRERVHFHGHVHPGGGAHFHGHSHGDARGQAAGSRRASHAADPHRHGHRMPVALFGLGSIAGMAMLSGAVAFSINLSGRKLTRLHGAFNGVLAALSMLLGLRLLAGW